MKKIAIIGFGVVGSGVAEVIEMNKDKIKDHLGEALEVKYILDIRDFPDSPFADKIVHDADTVFGDEEVSIVVETIGGAKIAYEYTKRALSAGKSVVTSNKELVSTHGVELMQLADDNSCGYLFEAAVGGGIPIIRPLHRCLAANQIMRIAGIVNGTTNYILSNMRSKGLSYDEALKQAQANGYAEANPTADVEGIDAQRKLSILSTIALSGEYVAPGTINTTGISSVTLDDIEFAEKLGCSLKLLAVFTHPMFQKPACFVAPHIVSKKQLIASVDDVFNAILVEGNALGESMFYGQGAGKLPTASAVVGDVLDAALHEKRDAHVKKWYVSEKDEVILPYEEIVTDIIVKAAPSNVDSIKNAFGEYETETVLDDSSACAVIVKGIMHKEIDNLLSSVVGASWFHYMA
ncbi:MAG: homoserine dehydrogenase [Clostridia bacterium]|nr:homoserine dehydrogenase [Clostridia bacterium]